jgi:hypothetical protein
MRQNIGDYYAALSRDVTTGADLVEVGLLDDLSPQVKKILGQEEDPRDLVEIAIREATIRGLPIAQGMSSLGFYANEGDTMTPDEARIWAAHVIAERGLCEMCGRLLTDESVCDELYEEARFCGDTCWQRWVTPALRPDLFDEVELVEA